MISALVAACGSSSTSIPKGSVASVDGNPITLKAVDHWMYIAAKEEAAELAEEGETEPVITAPDPPGFADCIKQVRVSVTSLAKDSDKTIRADCKEVFSEYMPEVVDYLIEAYWYQADAHKLGVTYSASAQKKELASIVKEFKTKAAYTSYLKQSGETQQDITFQVHVGGVYDKLLAHYEKPVTKAAIAAYYEAHKSSFATQATSTGHLIRVKTQGEAAAAVAALKSGTSWDAVAKQYAEDAASKTDGGAVKEVAPNTYETAASNALFDSPLNTVEGPIKGDFGYYVIEVTSKTPEVQKTLAEESSTIKSTLTTDAKNSAETKVTSYSKANFGKETLCTKTYSTADCAGYKAPVTTTTPAAATTTPATTTASSSSTTSSTGTTTSGATTTAASTSSTTTSGATSTASATTTTTAG